MHYFSTNSNGFNIIFCIPSAESPSSVAGNVLDFVIRNLDGTWIPCSGTGYATHAAEQTVANTTYALSRITTTTVSGVKSLKGYGVYLTGSTLAAGEFVSAIFIMLPAYSYQLEWTHSIEI